MPRGSWRQDKSTPDPSPPWANRTGKRPLEILSQQSGAVFLNLHFHRTRQNRPPTLFSGSDVESWRRRSSRSSSAISPRRNSAVCRAHLRVDSDEQISAAGGGLSYTPPGLHVSNRQGNAPAVQGYCKLACDCPIRERHAVERSAVPHGSCLFRHDQDCVASGAQQSKGAITGGKESIHARFSIGYRKVELTPVDDDVLLNLSEVSQEFPPTICGFAAPVGLHRGVIEPTHLDAKGSITIRS